MLYEVAFGAICVILWDSAYSCLEQRAYHQAVEAITGWPMSSWKLMKTAERSITLARVFNLREGFTSREDTLRGGLPLPRRQQLERGGRGPGEALFGPEGVLPDDGMGRDRCPTHGRLVELNIEWAAQYLPAGR